MLVPRLVVSVLIFMNLVASFPSLISSALAPTSSSGLANGIGLGLPRGRVHLLVLR